MIVSLEREKMNDLVQTALRAVSPRATMPILSGLLLKAEDETITASGTDLEMSIRSKTEANVQESGSTVVSGRLLGDITKNLGKGELRLQSGDKFLTLSTDSGEYRIREMMPEDFPQIPQWEGEALLKAEGTAFVKAVQQTSRASSTDEKRPVLTGSLIEKNVNDGSIRIVTTDSYRLAWKDLKVSGSVSEWHDCVVPTKTLNEVARLAGSAEGEVELRMHEKQVMFKIDDLLVSSRLIEGQFPNYKQLVPDGEKTHLKIKKDDLIPVLKRALIFGHNLRVGVYSDHMRITTETPEVGDSKEEVPAEVEGEEMEIGFNGMYLMDGVNGVESESIVMKMDEPQKPALVREEEEENYAYILMPVRLR